MFAKQTQLAGSLVVVIVLGGSAALAQAEPDPPVPGHDETSPQPPAVVASPTAHQPTGTFTVGGGISTDDKFVARVSLEQAHLFRTNNLVALDTLVSSRRQLFELRFAHPDLFGSDVSFAATMYNDRRVLPGFTRSAAGFAGALSRPVAEHVNAFIGYRLEGITVEDIHNEHRNGSGTSAPHELLLSSLRAGLAYTTLDTPLMPRSGTSAGVSLEVADPRLGSDIQVTRFHSWLHTHQPFGPFTLHLGTTFAAVGSRDPHGVPMSERLFFDGSSVIRGYAPGSLGPRTGGSFELTGRAELELPLVRRLGLSTDAFVDAGAIVDKHGNGQLGHSAGFGVIWRSPIGALRFDVAYPLEGGPPRFVFGIGL